MIINTDENEEIEDFFNEENGSVVNNITDDDFFAEFSKPREFFDKQEFVQEKKVDLFSENSITVIDPAVKKKTAEEIVSWGTFAIDFIISIFTGVEESGRYEPTKEHKKKLTEEVAKRLPDGVQLPSWLQLVMIIGMSYLPIISLVKSDLKQKKELQELEKKIKEESEIKNEPKPTDEKDTDNRD